MTTTRKDTFEGLRVSDKIRNLARNLRKSIGHLCERVEYIDLQIEDYTNRGQFDIVEEYKKELSKVENILRIKQNRLKNL